MTMLRIHDLPRSDTLPRGAMRSIRGGIATITLPPNGNPGPLPPSMPGSWPGVAAILKDLHIPVTWPGQPVPQTQDPRLL
ncbi:hypothetical protein AWB77_01765 [Caballeronia fortuita]|uniref:Uncharacterized protein n=1 Tax=Caballeronia fortuita TaxID=1777138 RepID=A0A158AGA6_9BURK|nr:hypothetical protein [Caballeronia fortuita]SAK56852.1 hypothetical protein AWB77_01765 [Caballeronia fortuita]